MLGPLLLRLTSSAPPRKVMTSRCMMPPGRRRRHDPSSQVAAPDHVRLFDVALLGRAVFDDGSEPLRGLLEDPAVTKLMFDCRRDSDALFHQFQVRLAGVLDVQLEHVAARRLRNRTERLSGLANAVRDFVSQARPAAAAGAVATN